jgi:hypothetical protein
LAGACSTFGDVQKEREIEKVKGAGRAREYDGENNRDFFEVRF